MLGNCANAMLGICANAVNEYGWVNERFCLYQDASNKISNAIESFENMCE